MEETERELVLRMRDRLDRLERDFHEAKGKADMVHDLLETRLDAIRMDLHAAKIGGRWILGVALGLGGLVGWIINLFMDLRK